MSPGMADRCQAFGGEGPLEEIRACMLGEEDCSKTPYMVSSARTCAWPGTLGAEPVVCRSTIPVPRVGGTPPTTVTVDLPALPTFSAYRWYAQGYDDHGNVGAAGRVGSIAADYTAPPTPAPFAPEEERCWGSRDDIQCTNELAPLLSFENPSSPEQVIHRIEVYLNVDRRLHLVAAQEVSGPAASVPVVRHSSTEVLPEGSLFWWVQTVDLAGNASEPGEGRLYIDRTPPQAPTLFAPVRLFLSVSFTPGGQPAPNPEPVELDYFGCHVVYHRVTESETEVNFQLEALCLSWTAEPNTTEYPFRIYRLRDGADCGESQPLGPRYFGADGYLDLSPIWGEGIVGGVHIPRPESPCLSGSVLANEEYCYRVWSREQINETEWNQSGPSECLRFFPQGD